MNKQAAERFEQAHGANIGTLIWIAGAHQSNEYDDMLESMDVKEFAKCFPEITCDITEIETDELKEIIAHRGKWGLLAEVHYPESRGFRFDKTGRPVSWSSSGISRIGYVYAEDLNRLLLSIEAEAKRLFDEFVAKAKAAA